MNRGALSALFLIGYEARRPGKTPHVLKMDFSPVRMDELDVGFPDGDLLLEGLDQELFGIMSEQLVLVLDNRGPFNSG